ncbi:unnamed protein product [marine sediment metagenome]|uniref:Uncharacterized protein n=1 Tax=marine sediment metagenome TaxID=412755 RepID=X1P031_9ZZZZ
MKSEEIINGWKDERSQIEVGQNFTEKVMSQVYLYEQKKKKLSFDMQRFVAVICGHPLVKAGMVAAGIIAGFIRMAFTVYVFLRT